MDRSPVPVTGAPVIQAFGGLNGYWGQLGSEPLKAYCDSHPEYITLSFVNQAPEHNPSNLPGTNFAGHCAGGTYGNSNLLSECYTIQEGIPYCKDRGVKVLLSIGGVYSDEGSNYKVTTDDKGRGFADFLYKSFGPHNEHSNPIRPFDSVDNDGNIVHAAVDGFDFDIEHDLPNGPYIAMINRLRELDEGLTITGAPQCPTSDEYFYMKDMIKSAKFDALFVQFYNNPWCDAVSQGHEGESFNYDKWVEIIEESDCSKDAKLYVGLPASEEAAPSGGYLEPEDLKDLVCELTTKPHFGGVSLWDLTRGAGNIIDGKSYNEHVMDALKYGCDPVPVPTTTTSAMTTTTEEASTSTDITTTEATTVHTTTTSDVSTTSGASSTEDATSTDITTASDVSSTEEATATSDVSASASTDATTSMDATSTDTAASSEAVASTDTTAATNSDASTSADVATSMDATPSTDATASADATASTDVTTSSDASASTDATASTETTATGANTSSVVTDSAASGVSATATESSADTATDSTTDSASTSDVLSATSDLTVTSDTSSVTGAASSSTIDAPVESDTATGTAATTNVSGATESTASAMETEPATIATAYSTYRGWNTTSTGAAAYTQAYGNPATLAHSGSLTTEGSPAYTNYPGNTGAVSMTTSTVCTTRVHTVTQCPPEVVDCLFGSVTTETIPLYTTVCPVTDKAKHTGYATQYAPPPQYETRTVYTTSVHAINKCAPGVIDCPYGSVTTETIPVYTTICPVTEAYNQAPTDVPVNHEIKTLYTSQVHTVAQCQPENPNCQVGAVTTEIASWTTAIVPAQETQLMKAYKPAAELPKPLTVESHLNGTVYTSVVVPPATLKTATKPGVFEQARPTYKQPAQEQHSGAAAPTGGRNDKGPIEIYAPAPITPATAGASSMVVGLTALAGIALLQVVALW
ncbi:hypothetical protein HYE67_000673 [Fusarium culmorum]|uniref:Endochitinase A1 n=1 Tax=Fusarium culmorum TaxID=5516 RepID=A0A2T4GQ04_FUSCU|nr:Endochitinase A1 [Fusarium culmorum]QPC58442.1 hypothetical protein HYE67_000673 [Fusarium culmorum]